VIIYSSGRENVAYIDALFFSSGASTQAGLNTVDFNRLNTFQQVVCYIIPMLANPITINSFVVFLRLYWFEKRFQNLVTEARTKRGSISKSKTRPRDDIIDAEKGVNGRSITVMHNDQPSRMTNDGIVLNSKVKDVEDSGSSDISGAGSANGHVNKNVTDHNSHNPQDIRITFADTVKRSDGLGEDAAKIPPARSEEEQHLAILKRQREDDEVLRIPGRLEAEQGLRPERVERGEHDDPAALEAVRSRPQAITIAEPDREMMRAAKEAGDTIAGEAKAVAGALSFLRPRKPRFLSEKDTKIHHEEDALHPPGRWRVQKRQTINALRTALSGDKDEGTPYLSWEPTIGRNSAFPDLSEEQREELGGIEYRSLKTLALVLTWYFWGFSLLGVIGLVPWILNVNRWGEVVDAAAQGRAWWGFFTANSAFMDLGFTLTPDSMNSFNTAVWPLLLMCFLIVIGNTGFPVMLRFIIWIMSLVIPRGTGLYEELRFLLDHPRRCFTLLFPSGATWWLFWLLIILNGLDVIFFIVLDVRTLPSDSSAQVANLPTAWDWSCNGNASWHQDSQRSFRGCVDTDGWILMRQSCRTSSWCAGLVHDHDVHFGVSDCHFRSSHQRLRRAVARSLRWRPRRCRRASAWQRPLLRRRPFAASALFRFVVHLRRTLYPGHLRGPPSDGA
jgi:hypothetical protein